MFSSYIHSYFYFQSVYTLAALWLVDIFLVGLVIGVLTGFYIRRSKPEVKKVTVGASMLLSGLFSIAFYQVYGSALAGMSSFLSFLEFIGSLAPSISPIYIAVLVIMLALEFGLLIGFVISQPGAGKEVIAYKESNSIAEDERPELQPIEKMAENFKSMGYQVLTLAKEKGRSGTLYTFDMEIKGHRGKGVVIEVIIHPEVGIDEISKAYGRLCDIDKESIVCVMPRLSMEAKKYARMHKMKIVEGETVKEVALRVGAYVA